MTGLEIGLLAWGIFVSALLIVAIGALDDLQAKRSRDRALTALRAISDNPKDMT